MSVIRTNQPNFFGNNAEPLQSGYIYIGQPNQDPINFEKVVTFQDSQGVQQTAAQPLRTNAQGQITFNGKAVIATVDGSYSMLMLDSTETQITGGFIPLIEPESTSGSSDLTDYREYGLTLADVKQLSVLAGQTVSSVGKSTATDNLGVDWLVAANTGGAADDVDLIDFDNGLQGLKIKNFIEEAATASDKAAVRANIDVRSVTESDAAYINDASSAVSSTNLASSSVTSSKLATNSVFASSIAADNVLNSKIPDNEIKSSKFDWSLNSFSSGSILAGGSFSVQLDSDFVFSPVFNEDINAINVTWQLQPTASPDGPALVIYNNGGGPASVTGGVLTVLF